MTVILCEPAKLLIKTYLYNMSLIVNNPHVFAFKQDLNTIIYKNKIEMLVFKYIYIYQELFTLSTQPVHQTVR